MTSTKDPCYYEEERRSNLISLVMRLPRYRS